MKYIALFIMAIMAASIGYAVTEEAIDSSWDFGDWLSGFFSAGAIIPIGGIDYDCSYEQTRQGSDANGDGVIATKCPYEKCYYYLFDTSGRKIDQQSVNKDEYAKLDCGGYCTADSLDVKLYSCKVDSSDSGDSGTEPCVDYDGFDYYKKSSAKQGSQTIVDKCDGDDLIEAACVPPDYNSIGVETVGCDYGCENGACKSKAENEYFCVDYDGEDYGRKSKTALYKGNTLIRIYEDKCEGGKILEGVSSSECKEGVIPIKEATCTAGCEEGACNPVEPTEYVAPSTYACGCCQYPSLLGTTFQWLSKEKCAQNEGTMVLDFVCSDNEAKVFGGDGTRPSDCDAEVDGNTGAEKPEQKEEEPESDEGFVTTLLAEDFEDPLTSPTSDEILESLCLKTSQCKEVAGYNVKCVPRENFEDVFGEDIQVVSGNILNPINSLINFFNGNSESTLENYPNLIKIGAVTPSDMDDLGVCIGVDKDQEQSLGGSITGFLEGIAKLAGQQATATNGIIVIVVFLVVVGIIMSLFGRGR